MFTACGTIERLSYIAPINAKRYNFRELLGGFFLGLSVHLMTLKFYS